MAQGQKEWIDKVSQVTAVFGIDVETVSSMVVTGNYAEFTCHRDGKTFIERFYRIEPA